MEIHPRTVLAARIRLALMPVEFGIAGLTVYGLITMLSKISGLSYKELFSFDDLWPLVVFLPGFFFGLILGFISTNCLSFLVPPIRRVFESEISQTGRPGFGKAVKDLSKVLAVLGVVTIIGSLLFLFVSKP